MDSNYISLDKLPPGHKGKVKLLKSDGTIRRRMLDLGLIQDTTVETLQKGPSGNLTAYFIRGAVIAIRSDEASNILVQCI